MAWPTKDYKKLKEKVDPIIKTLNEYVRSNSECPFCGADLNYIYDATETWSEGYEYATYGIALNHCCGIDYEADYESNHAPAETTNWRIK